MLKARRQNLILQNVNASGDASIAELSEAVGVSASTIRRDLRELSERGRLRLTHGGAVVAAPHLAAFELDSSLAAEVSEQEKAIIARHVAQEIHPGQTIIFDSSTTVLAVARLLAENATPITAITNSLDIASTLAKSQSIDVIVIGGRVRPRSSALIGDPGASFLKHVHADTLLLGTHAITGRLFTETSLDVVAIKQAMLQAVRRTIVLADASKFQPPALFTICEAEEVDEVVTDSSASEEPVAILREAGVTVTIAGTV